MKTVVFTCAYGHEYLTMLRPWYASLRRLGKYDGRVVVFTSDVGATEAAAPGADAHARPPTTTRHDALHRKIRDAVVLDGGGQFDVALYSDVDSVFLRPIDVLFASVGDVLVAATSTLAIGDPWHARHFAADDSMSADKRPSCNTGLFGFPVGCQTIHAWLTEILNWRSVSGQPTPGDQPILNHMYHSGEPIERYPAAWVQYPLHRQPLTDLTVVTHFAGVKGEDRILKQRVLLDSFNLPEV